MTSFELNFIEASCILLAYLLGILALASCPCFDYFAFMVNFPALLLSNLEIEDLDGAAR